jgi:hypothetical protein
MQKIKLLLLLIPVMLLASCVNEDDKLGLSLMSNEGETIDAFKGGIASMSSISYKEDTLNTADYRYYALGSYKDNNFGKVATTLYTQLALSSTSENFSNLGTADSVVLTLAYTGAFAKDTSTKTMNMAIQVYELNEVLDTSKVHAYDNVSVKSTPIFNSTVLIDPNTGITLAGDTAATNPHLRLKLSDAFMNRLASSSFEDNDAFINEFKGVKIVCNTVNDAGMAYVDVTSSISGIIYYYHTQSGYSGKYQINFPESNKFLHIDYDYSSSRYLRNMRNRHGRARTSSADSVLNDNYMFVSCLGQSIVKIHIDSLLQWYNQDSIKNSAFNKAELILPVADINDGNTKNYPSSLLCYRQDSTLVLIRDEIVSYATYYTGTYSSADNSYHLQITSHLQNYLKGKYSTPDIYIVPNNRRQTASRVVLNGRHSANPPRLEITFSHSNSNANKK